MVSQKIEQACSISKEVYVCCSIIVHYILSPTLREGARNLFNKKQVWIYKD